MADIKSTHSGGVIRVQVPPGAWGAIPTALIEDARLSLESRAAAAWLATRPTGWQIAVEPMLRAIPIGRSVWRRVARELENAGYLTRSRQPSGERGRFVWCITFCVIPSTNATHEIQEKSTIVQFSIDGQTIDGKPVDKSKKDLKKKDLKKKEVSKERVERTERTATATLSVSPPPAQAFRE